VALRFREFGEALGRSIVCAGPIARIDWRSALAARIVRCGAAPLYRTEKLRMWLVSTRAEPVGGRDQHIGECVESAKG